jgi:hypothetical protein
VGVPRHRATDTKLQCVQGGNDSAAMDHENADLLFLVWERRSSLAAIAHSRSANRCAAWHSRLGGTSVFLTAAVSSSVIAALQWEFGTVARLGVALLTVCAAGVAAVHTFAALADRRAAHETASRKHAAVRRRIETARAQLACKESQAGVWKEVDEIRGAMDTVAASNPNASGRIWDRVRRQMKGEFTRRERFWVRVKGLPLAPIGMPGEADGPRQPLTQDGE